MSPPPLSKPNYIFHTTKKTRHWRPRTPDPRTNAWAGVFLYDEECSTPPYGINNERTLTSFDSSCLFRKTFSNKALENLSSKATVWILAQTSDLNIVNRKIWWRMTVKDKWKRKRHAFEEVFSSVSALFYVFSLALIYIKYFFSFLQYKS